jgi:hypothetical protein
MTIQPPLVDTSPDLLNDPLSATQKAIRDRLKSFSYFDNIPVLTERIGDIEQQILTSLATIGLCCIVLTPNADMENIDAPTPMLVISAIVQVTELVTINQGPTGTKKPAAEVACTVLAALHHHEPKFINGIYGSPTGVIQLVPDESEAARQGQGNLIYHVALKTNGGIDYTITPRNLTI